jgi:uncharacterized protein (TIGR02145 family)
MKRINTLTFAFLLTFIISLSNISAQNDYMHIMKDGKIIGKFNVYSEVDSIIFYEPAMEEPIMEEPSFGTFIDSRDGREYNWVKKGNQVWMAENLSYAPSSGNYWVYLNKIEYIEIYGYLYDWETALNVCPPDWHLPSDEEWTQLTDVPLKQIQATGTIEAGTGLWRLHTYSTAPTNETGFTALPGGIRSSDGVFSGRGIAGRWWSATEYGTTDSWRAWNRRVHYAGFVVMRDFNSKRMGMSVRCVKD